MTKARHRRAHSSSGRNRLWASVHSWSNSIRSPYKRNQLFLSPFCMPDIRLELVRDQLVVRADAPDRPPRRDLPKPTRHPRLNPAISPPHILQIRRLRFRVSWRHFVICELSTHGALVPPHAFGHDTAAPPRRLSTSLRLMGLARVRGCPEATCGLVGDQGGSAAA